MSALQPRALDAAIKRAILKGRASSWELSKLLYEFNRQQGWTALGFDTQTEWLDQGEIGMSKRHYHRYVACYKTLGAGCGLTAKDVADIDISRLGIVAPLIDDGVLSVDEALSAARTMNPRELWKAYRRSSAGDLVADAAVKIAKISETSYQQLEAMKAIAAILSDASLSNRAKVVQALVVCDLFGSALSAA